MVYNGISSWNAWFGGTHPFRKPPKRASLCCWETPQVLTHPHLKWRMKKRTLNTHQQSSTIINNNQQSSTIINNLDTTAEIFKVRQVCRLSLFRIYSLARPRRPLPFGLSHISTQLCSAKFTGMNSRAFSVQSRCKLKIDRSSFCMRVWDVFVALLMVLPLMHFCLVSVDECCPVPFISHLSCKCSVFYSKNLPNIRVAALHHHTHLTPTKII